MGFFVKEYFNLPDGYFQESINTAVAGSGSVYQDGTYGYIQTSANADAAIIVSDESLSAAEFFNKAITFSLSYQLTSLPDGDSLSLMQDSKQRYTSRRSIRSVITSYYCRLTRTGATYYERWYYYDASATLRTYDGAHECVDDDDDQ